MECAGRASYTMSHTLSLYLPAMYPCLPTMMTDVDLAVPTYLPPCCRPGGCTNIILRRRSPAGALREQSLVTQGMQSDARASAWRAFAAFANASRTGMLLVQPRPPVWLAESLGSSSPLGKQGAIPPFETARGTVFLVAGGIVPRAGDGRRIKELQLEGRRRSYMSYVPGHLTRG
jgi:hypothetical protein